MTFKLQMTTQQTLRFVQDVRKMSDDEVVYNMHYNLCKHFFSNTIIAV